MPGSEPRRYAMRSTVIGVLLLVSVAARSTEAQTEAHNEVMLAMEAVRLAALAGDAEKLDAVMSDDCTLVLASGRLVAKPQYLAVVRGGALAFEALTYEDVVIRVYANTAVVTHILNINERIGGVPTSGRFRSTRVLVKGERGWRFVAFHSTKV
jgi:ketosteroid isomerase-like protein